MKHTSLSLDLPVSYVLEAPSLNIGPDEETKKILILHGFGDKATSARKRLLGESPFPQWTLFAPNGFFPYPVEREGGFKSAYAWYFKDVKSGREMISPQLASQALIKLMNELKMSLEGWTIIGFSQGGFFAPHLIREGLGVDHFIGVGAGYRPESFTSISLPRFDAIHGDLDKVIPIEHARLGFEKINSGQNRGTFYEIKNLGHTLNDEGRKLLRSLIES